jgi:hypothetical protein
MLGGGAEPVADADRAEAQGLRWFFAPSIKGTASPDWDDEATVCHCHDLS